MLLGKGANIDATSDSRWGAALHMAADSGNSEVVEVLLD